MKRLAFFIGLLLIYNNLVAQKTLTENYNTNGISQVDFKFQYAENIKVKNWNKTEVQVIAEVNINDNKDNNKFVLQQDKIGGILKIKSDYKDLFSKKGNYVVYGSDTDSKVYNCGSKVVVNYTVYVPKTVAVKVKSISGSIKIDELKNNIELDLVSGDIDVKKHSKNMKLKTVSGDIDVIVEDAEFKAQTVTGNVYSNLDIDFNKNKKRSYGSKIVGTVANGNAKLLLNTVSGDLLLRKN